MKRYYKKKTNVGGKVVAVLVCIAVVLVAFFGIVTKGFTVKDPKQWFGKDAPVEASLTLDTTSVVFKGGTTSAPEVKTLNATLITSDEDAELTWTLEKVGASGAVSGVTLTPSEDGSSATVVCSTSFTTPLRVKAHVPGTDLLAVATVDCLGSFDNVYCSEDEVGEPGSEWGLFIGLCTDGGSYIPHAYVLPGTFSLSAVRLSYEIVLKATESCGNAHIPEGFEYVLFSGDCQELAYDATFTVEYTEDDLRPFCDKLVALGIDEGSFVDGPYGLTQLFEQGEFEFELRLIQSAGGQSVQYADSCELYFWNH